MLAAHIPLAFLQTPTYAMSDGQFHTLIWFTGLIALWLFLQAVALIAVAFMVVKLLRTINEFTERIETKTLAITDRFEGKIYPLLDNVQDLMNDAVPKIKRVTDNIAETTDVYRAKLAEVDALITDTTAKAKRQSDRIDGMITSTLATAGNLAGRVEHAVVTPVRQVGAIFNGLWSAAAHMVDSLAQPRPKATPKPVAFEGETVYTGLEDDYHA